MFIFTFIFVIFRTDQMLVRLNDLATKGSVLKGSVRELDSRLEVIENRQASFRNVSLHFPSGYV